jgi:hypothetical protein
LGVAVRGNQEDREQKDGKEERRNIQNKERGYFNSAEKESNPISASLTTSPGNRKRKDTEHLARAFVEDAVRFKYYQDYLGLNISLRIRKY